jgi:hypothetical protein
LGTLAVSSLAIVEEFNKHGVQVSLINLQSLGYTHKSCMAGLIRQVYF